MKFLSLSGLVLMGITWCSLASAQSADSVLVRQGDKYRIKDSLIIALLQKKPMIEKVGNYGTPEMMLFDNDSLKEALMIILYTDYFRAGFVHFNLMDIPEWLPQNCLLEQTIPEQKNIAAKQSAFNDLLQLGIDMPPSFFVSKAGFRLGDSLSKAIQFYGAPDSTYTEEKYTVLKWSFNGELLLNLHAGETVIANSYGQEVFMYFRDEKLVMYQIFNAVP